MSWLEKLLPAKIQHCESASLFWFDQAAECGIEAKDKSTVGRLVARCLGAVCAQHTAITRIVAYRQFERLQLVERHLAVAEFGRLWAALGHGAQGFSVGAELAGRGSRPIANAVICGPLLQQTLLENCALKERVTRIEIGNETSP